MSIIIEDLLRQYIKILKDIYGFHLKSVILYGSYARGDYTIESDIDIMILLDLSNIDIKNYRHELSEMTYEFNMDNDIEIKPIAKSKEYFQKWVNAYPFYSNICKEGVKLFDVS